MQSQGKAIKVWNVKEEGAQGNGTNDDTQAIQAIIKKASPGDTVLIPEGTYIITTLGLVSGINIKAEGILQQKLDTQEEYSKSRQNSSQPLLRGKDVQNIHLSVHASSLNEGIYLSGSKNITIANSSFKGDSTKLRSFAGILLYKCENITVSHSGIQNFGTDRLYTDHYQPGTGIRILESKDISISHSTIQHNGENGVFIHGSPDIEVSNCDISYNGMSGIQLAFGKSGLEKDYRFTHNILNNNGGDAIDINNRISQSPLAIHALIADNQSKANGFVKDTSTPDGSGIATLVNVSKVEVMNNTAYDNNRPAVYLEGCGEIHLTGNTADNQVEIVGGLNELTMMGNTFDNITFINNVRAGRICIENNQLNTLHLPNGISIDSLQLLKNEISNALLNFNLSGTISLTGNKLISNAKSPAILLVKADAALLTNNEILSHQSMGMVIRKMAQNVRIVNNTIQAKNTCITDDGSPNLLIKGNRLTALQGGNHFQTIRSKNPNNLQLINNQHTGKSKAPVLVMEGKGTASMQAENIIQGETNFGQVKVTKDNL
ncbi:right-handed parallel beta-helix repeat-containing protein [Echinicola sediminis]